MKLVVATVATFSHFFMQWENGENERKVTSQQAEQKLFSAFHFPHFPKMIINGKTWETA